MYAINSNIKLYFLNRYFVETDPDFTLEKIMQMEMQKYGDQINEISNRATMELNIENVTIIIVFFCIVIKTYRA